jgi:hypothetical protein
MPPIQIGKRAWQSAAPPDKKLMGGGSAVSLCVSIRAAGHLSALSDAPVQSDLERPRLDNELRTFAGDFPHH